MRILTRNHVRSGRYHHERHRGQADGARGDLPGGVRPLLERLGGLSFFCQLNEWDLGNIESVRAAVAQASKEPRIDALINNAGVMHPPLTRARQGFESQFGVNHLGVFALTSLLLPKLAGTPGARIVVTSSIAYSATGSRRAATATARGAGTTGRRRDRRSACRPCRPAPRPGSPCAASSRDPRPLRPRSSDARNSR